MTRRAAWLGLLVALLVTAMPARAYQIEVPDFGLLERQLRLKPIQKAQFDIAVQASQRALMSVALAGLQVRERLAAEVFKPLPDLNALYRLQEEAYEMTAPNFREAALEWERLYSMLERWQIEAARRFLEQYLSSPFR